MSWATPPAAAKTVAFRSLKWAVVDRRVLRENTRAIVDLVGPGVEVMAMVKGNGYGHGLVTAARCALEGGATWLGVSSPDEALTLRAEGITAPVLIVGWCHPEALDTIVAADVDVSVVAPEDVAVVVDAARRCHRPAGVHVKVDTGMHRLGLDPPLAVRVLRELAECPEVELRGLFTHFADADGAGSAPTEAQLARFAPVVAVARELSSRLVVHAANSAALLRFPETRYDLVRVGILLYGYVPPRCPALCSVRPAMSVAAWITQVKAVPAGDSVGYGRTWTAPSERLIAAVATGYADGVHRAQSNRGSVLVRGHRCPIVGAVSMDQLTVDVTEVAGVRPGDVAVLVGGDGSAHIGADEVADVVGTIPYEVLCAVSARVPRLVVG